MIKTREEVEAFLHQFMPKLDIWGIFFINRTKNEHALTTLGITGHIRERIIHEIKAIDYVETIINTINFGDIWVFGKDWDKTELYIKISMGLPGSETICISFHEAEFPMNYAFKRR